MKKILVSCLVLVVLVITAGVVIVSSKKIDLKNYVKVTAQEPVMNESLEIENPKYDISIDINKLQEESEALETTLDDDTLESLNNLEFKVNGKTEEDYDWTDNKYRVKLVNKNLLKGTGLKWIGKYKFDMQSDSYLEAFNDYTAKKEILQIKIDNLPEFEPYIEAADVLNDFYKDQYKDIATFAVNEEAFGFAKDVYGIKSEIYTLSDEEKQFLDSDEVYYVISATNQVDGDNEKQFRGYIMDDFSFVFSSTFRVPMMCLDNSCEDEYYEGLYVEDVGNEETGVAITYQGETEYFESDDEVQDIYEFINEKNEGYIPTVSLDTSVIDFAEKYIIRDEDQFSFNSFYAVVAAAGYHMIEQYPDTYSDYMSGFVGGPMD